MRAYVLSTNLEISGFGRIYIANGDIYVEEVKIFEQEVSHASTDLDQKALSKFWNEIIDTEGDLSNWKLWWHSHNTMDVFFSGTDMATIEDFDTEMAEDNWMLSLVTNHAGDILCRADVFRPIRSSIEDIKVIVEDWDNPFTEEVALEVKEKVREKVVKNYNYNNGYFPKSGNKGAKILVNKNGGYEWEDYY